MGQSFDFKWLQTILSLLELSLLDLSCYWSIRSLEIWDCGWYCNNSKWLLSVQLDKNVITSIVSFSKRLKNLVKTKKYKQLS